MNDKRILQILTDDLSTEGHYIGDAVREMADEDLLDMDSIIHHWWFQVNREVELRSLTPRLRRSQAKDDLP